VHILWTKKRIAEQHLEGDCKDLDKLKVEIHGIFPNGDGAETHLLPVHHVQSSSDGTLQIFVEPRKDNS